MRMPERSYCNLCNGPTPRTETGLCALCHDPRAWSGVHIVLEGIDGTGKSTQAKLLAERLERDGFSVVLTREPTDGVHGQKLREAAQDGQRLLPWEELHLFIEDRKEHLRDVVLPALRAGKVVVQDRYFMSTCAYQGDVGSNPPSEVIFQQHLQWAPLPNKTYLLELKPRKALKRIQNSRGAVDAFEKLEDLERCAAAFKAMAFAGLHRTPAELEEENIHTLVWWDVSRLLGRSKVRKRWT